MVPRTVRPGRCHPARPKKLQSVPARWGRFSRWGSNSSPAPSSQELCSFCPELELVGRDWWDGTGGTGLVGRDWWDGTGGTGLVGRDWWDGTGGTGLSGRGLAGRGHASTACSWSPVPPRSSFLRRQRSSNGTRNWRWDNLHNCKVVPPQVAMEKRLRILRAVGRDTSAESDPEVVPSERATVTGRSLAALGRLGVTQTS
jgi:hypothetical protein